MDFRIDANGVTPIPAPIHITTGYLKTSYTKKITTITIWDKSTNKQTKRGKSRSLRAPRSTQTYEVMVSPFVLLIELMRDIISTKPLRHIQNLIRLTVVAVPKGPSTASLQTQNTSYQLIS